MKAVAFFKKNATILDVSYLKIRLILDKNVMITPILHRYTNTSNMQLI